MQELLTPTQITLNSGLKNFGLDKGASEASEASVTFTVNPPEGGVNRVDLKKAMLLEQQRLDLFVLAAQRLKGAINDDAYRHHREIIKSNYELALGRTKTAGPGDGAAGQSSGDEAGPES